jgi:ribosome-binding factor A
MVKRLDRLEPLFLREISIFLSKNVSRNLNGLITITGVKITKNLSNALVYFSVIGPDESIDKAKEELQNLKQEIWRELSKRLTIKKVPSLKFEFDPTARTAQKIETIFTKLESEKNDQTEH